MRFRPFGNGILNAMVIGRDVNVVAGFATLLGHYTYAGNLFSVNLFISGAIALVMGGVLTMVGGNTINSNLMQVQIGVVCQIGAYAGTFASIGWGYTSTNGLLFRQNGGQFGVVLGFSYMTGFVQGRAWGLGTVFGPGQVGHSPTHVPSSLFIHRTIIIPSSSTSFTHSPTVSSPYRPTLRCKACTTGTAGPPAPTPFARHFLARAAPPTLALAV